MTPKTIFTIKLIFPTMIFFAFLALAESSQAAIFVDNTVSCNNSSTYCSVNRDLTV